MHPYSYPVVGYDPATCAAGHCCVHCARLDAKPATYEPHRELVKTGEDSEHQGQQLHYVCRACGTTWTRFVKNHTRGNAYYWHARPSDLIYVEPRCGRGTSGRVMAGDVMRRRVPELWYIEGTDVECVHCSQGYAYEREVRCAECDAPMCPLCVVRIEARTVCPDCTKEHK
jgi:hypothetical protein